VAALLHNERQNWVKLNHNAEAKTTPIFNMLLNDYPHVFPFEAETCLNNIQEFSPYHKENTTLHHYKDQLVKVV
jgi:hypothetical protein